MISRFSVLAEAELDIDDAYVWYESEEPNLGVAFVEQVEQCFVRISSNPKIYAVVEGPVRRALVHRFPYAVYFVLDGDEVTVFAVLHMARDIGEASEPT